MLVLDPKKRLTIAQVCQHQWMAAASEDVRSDPAATANWSPDPSVLKEKGAVADGHFNEHVLRVMRNLNIDEQKTLQVSIHRCPVANQ
jgi:hypothetical protein